MEQSLADIGEGEELLDTKVGVVHLTKIYGLYHYASIVTYGHYSADKM